MWDKGWRRGFKQAKEWRKGRLYRWLDERLNLGPIRMALLDEHIPGGASCIYIFGNITHFFFVLQMVTGMFLAIYYSPSTEHAHVSIQYIMDEVASLPKSNPSVLRGKVLYQELDCAGCHRIHGKGESFAPDLSYVADIRERDWFMRHFRDPQAVVPYSEMPEYEFNEEELSDLTNYRLILKR